MKKVEKVGSQTIVRDSESGEFEHGTTVPDSSTLSKVRNNMKLRDHMSQHAEELIDKAVELAKMGSEPALKLCIDKILPNKKYDTIKIQMYGQISNMKDVMKMSGTILESLCEGMIAPEQAKQVCDVLDIHSSNIEKVEISNRIDKLEQLFDKHNVSSDVEYLKSEN